MRIVRLVLFYVLGLVLGGAATYASAETIPATDARYYRGNTTTFGPVVGPYPVDGTNTGPQDACAAGGWYFKSTYPIGCYTAPNGGGAIVNISNWIAKSCPPNQGWTLNGNNCVRADCPAGTVRDNANGGCDSSCPAAGSRGASTGTIVEGSGSSVPSSTCIGGCVFDIGSGIAVPSFGWAGSVGRATGAACSASTAGTNGSPTADTPPDTAAPTRAADCVSQGQGYGTINGTVVCTGPADSTVKRDTKTESVTRPDGSTGTETKTTTTICNEAGSCTTTTTTNISGGGISGSATNGTSTGTKTQDIGSFCQENPTSPQCKANEQEDYCKLHPDSIGCKDAGTPSDGSEQVGTKQIGVSSITPVVLATNMSCPPDVALPKNFGTIKMQPACDFAGWVRPLVLAFAWLSAGLIVIGAVRT